MASQYLNRLSSEDRQQLENKLFIAQNKKCFICEQDIDLQVQKGNLDIDHVIPLKLEGKDDPSNFALTHASCNRSKQASNLEVARILKRFAHLKETLASENRNPNLGDILKQASSNSYSLGFKIEDNQLIYSFSDLQNNAINTVPIYKDDLSGFQYFFIKLPIEYLAHDNHINPRSIGSNISKLVEEFYQKRPQLHVPLGWISSKEGKSSVYIFDGQHKAAAQIMLGAKELPIRVFIDPDQDTLITTNTNAGTTLKQVAFDKSVQRHLGSSLYRDRIARYQKETGREDDDLNFSEKNLSDHFKGQSREIKRYILDALRDSITSDPNNKLRDYIDFGGRGKERPLSYSTVEKTFYSFFIFQEILETPINYKMDSGENPRQLEQSQILRLMNIIAEEIYIDKFDTEIGTDKIENRLQKGDIFSHDHIRAFRMSKEEIVYNWLKYIAQIARQYFIMQGKPDPGERLFQVQFPEQVWDNIRRFLHNFSNLPFWVNIDLSATVFGGKQNNSFWENVFTSGSTPQGMQIMPEPVNLLTMIQS